MKVHREDVIVQCELFFLLKKKQKKYVWKKTAHFTETWFFSSDIQILFPVKNVDIFSVGAVGVIL